MQTETFTVAPWLMIGTFIAVLAVAVLLYTRFMSKPSNRHPDPQPDDHIGERLEGTDAKVHDNPPGR